MKNYLAFFLFLTITTASAHGPLPARLTPPSDLILTGLTDSDTTAGGTARLCEQVTFSRGLRYGENEANVLDVAASTTKADTPRPVLLFVAGDSFTGDRAAPELSRQIQDQVMCFAARNDMIGVRVNYRLAPAATWPMGATDVAAALSWVHGNIDLFNGDAREIVAVGYGAGAFHVATLLAHPEFQADRADVAAVVLVSGIYRAGKDASDSEKAYLGGDASQYNARSVFPGILNVDVPIVLAWAADDSPGLVTQGETLKKTLCGAGHCPRSALLRSRDGIASAFGLDGSGDSLAEPTLLLVHQLEARGLP
ncbi:MULTISPECIES: alpha/beta hydrolase [Bradyrhizobium]|uniref:Acetyl esterase/lipase n=1 Tax=Bradyrhizobium ottawaense TaxID=931866 RepID=A0ABV4FM21_9BRAD|nr:MULTISPECIES: carboxylesterase family protein [Bradyrhizobium]MBR1290727.1 carboxylesterase family protein [Bradyrhizobium ottawaense]MDA9417679.1 carboxylesterase [Bradyrhizobium sp. CCBAU 25360]MDA9483694.1 carboxylesterase [Bradyrhizobium sp. CCBAU 11445]PDT70397.1 carboxylesterase [Bradyrhizobium ottawaense]WLB45323.1 carboxylesterase family protein [Bradyrhizobium ottawaense]